MNGTDSAPLVTVLRDCGNWTVNANGTFSIQTNASPHASKLQFNTFTDKTTISQVSLTPMPPTNTGISTCTDAWVDEPSDLDVGRLLVNGNMKRSTATTANGTVEFQYTVYTTIPFAPTTYGNPYASFGCVLKSYSFHGTVLSTDYITNFGTYTSYLKIEKGGKLEFQNFSTLKPQVSRVYTDAYVFFSPVNARIMDPPLQPRPKKHWWCNKTLMYVLIVSIVVLIIIIIAVASHKRKNTIPFRQTPKLM